MNIDHHTPEDQPLCWQDLRESSACRKLWHMNIFQQNHLKERKIPSGGSESMGGSCRLMHLKSPRHFYHNTCGNCCWSSQMQKYLTYVCCFVSKSLRTTIYWWCTLPWKCHAKKKWQKKEKKFESLSDILQVPKMMVSLVDYQNQISVFYSKKILQWSTPYPPIEGNVIFLLAFLEVP
jgi:hypothetical protein